MLRRQDSGSRSSGCFALGLLLALGGGLELAAGGQNVVAPSCAHRRRDMRGREPVGEARYGRRLGAFEEAAGPGMKGMRFTLAGMPFSRPMRRRASSSLSFTPFSMTYSKVMRRALWVPG